MLVKKGETLPELCFPTTKERIYKSMKSMFNDEITKTLTDEIDGYLDYVGSEFMSDFYSQISDTFVETEKDKVTVYDSRDCNICEIKYKDIDKLKDYIYS